MKYALNKKAGEHCLPKEKGPSFPSKTSPSSPQDAKNLKKQHPGGHSVLIRRIFPPSAFLQFTESIIAEFMVRAVILNRWG